MTAGSILRPSALRAMLAAILLVLTSLAGEADEAAWAALREGGAAAVMRHALAPGTGDPANFTLGDCATQRNLSDRGRDQARAIGAAFRERGVRADRVLSSKWCRCLETAELLDLGPVEPFAPLNSFFSDRSTREEQTEATRDYLAGLPDGATPVLVTHQVNVSALTGRSTSSGEIIVIRLGADGTVEVVGEINVSW